MSYKFYSWTIDIVENGVIVEHHGRGGMDYGRSVFKTINEATEFVLADSDAKSKMEKSPIDGYDTPEANTAVENHPSAPLPLIT